MIWPIVPILRRYALPLGILLAIGVAYAWHRTETNAARRQGYEQAQSEGKAAIAELDRQTALREAEEREISRAHEVASLESRNALQAQIDRLTARPVSLGRLQKCADRREPSAAGGSATTAQSDGGAGYREHDLPAQPDLGLELVRYAGTCEQYRRQLSELQAWVSETLAER